MKRPGGGSDWAFHREGKTKGEKRRQAPRIRGGERCRPDLSGLPGGHVHDLCVRHDSAGFPGTDLDAGEVNGSFHYEAEEGQIQAVSLLAEGDELDSAVN